MDITIYYSWQQIILFFPQRDKITMFLLKINLHLLTSNSNNVYVRSFNFNNKT